MQRRIGTLATLALTGAIGLAACQPLPPTPPVPGDPSATSTTVVTTSTAPPATTAPTTVPVTTTTAPPAPGGWQLVGGDEFNDSALDGSKWKAYHNTYGDGNKELACLTPNNVVESGGSLKLISKREQMTCPSGSVRQYTSGFVGSREVGRYYPMFGRYEMRAKIPHAQGIWPAFWLRYRDGGAPEAEVDIMESFHSQLPGKTNGTLHLDSRHNLAQGSIPVENTTSPGWHTWAVEISKAPNGVRFVWQMDGVTYLDTTDTVHQWKNVDPNATWDIALNQAVGGTWIGGPDDTLGYLRELNRCSLGGTAPSGCNTANLRRVDWNNPGSNTYEIDYVRVYTR